MGHPRNGKELDLETGLYDFGARDYDPRLGTWISPDPILDRYIRGEPGGGVLVPINLGLYSYAWNNPVTVRDPNGACPQCIGDTLASQAGDSPRAKAQFQAFNRGTAIAGAFLAVGAGAAVVGSVADSVAAWLGWGVRARAVAAAAGASAAATQSPAAQQAVQAVQSKAPALESAAETLAEQLASQGEQLAQGAADAIPQIAKASNREMLGQALEHVRALAGTASQKADLFDRLAAQINKLSGGSWSALRGLGTEAPTCFLVRRVKPWSSARSANSYAEACKPVAFARLAQASSS